MRPMPSSIWHDAATEQAPFGRVWVAYEGRNGWQVAEARRTLEVDRLGVFYVRLDSSTAGVKWLFMQVPCWSDAQERPLAPDQVAEQGAMW